VGEGQELMHGVITHLPTTKAPNLTIAVIDTENISKIEVIPCV
jgi:hypothetical protein